LHVKGVLGVDKCPLRSPRRRRARQGDATEVRRAVLDFLATSEMTRWVMAEKGR
jgi:hypothetical protein